MRLALIVLLALVFLGGLFLDTGALLTLAGDFVRAHARYVLALGVVAIALGAGWRALRRRRSVKPRGRAGPTQRGGRRPQRAGGSRRRNGGTRARS